MLSVKTLNTANFSFTITNTDSDGIVTLEIKPTTKTGKDLFRFKKWGKSQFMHSNKELVFGDVDGYEQKLQILASI